MKYLRMRNEIINDFLPNYGYMCHWNILSYEMKIKKIITERRHKIQVNESAWLFQWLFLFLYSKKYLQSMENKAAKMLLRSQFKQQ